MKATVLLVIEGNSQSEVQQAIRKIETAENHSIVMSGIYDCADIPSYQKVTIEIPKDQTLPPFLIDPYKLEQTATRRRELSSKEINLLKAQGVVTACNERFNHTDPLPITSFNVKAINHMLIGNLGFRPIENVQSHAQKVTDPTHESYYLEIATPDDLYNDILKLTETIYQQTGAELAEMPNLDYTLHHYSKYSTPEIQKYIQNLINITKQLGLNNKENQETLTHLQAISIMRKALNQKRDCQ